MVERQKRLKEVFEYVRNNFGIHTQIDFAEALHKSRNAISLALNGNELYLTDKLFKNICEVYPGVFNLDYLLTGEGSLLSTDEEIHNEDTEKMFDQQSIDHSSLVNAALAAKDETIKTLEGRLRDKDRIIQLLENELRGLKLDAEMQRSLSGYHDMMSNLVSEENQ
jgi:transcriptional regulator with XRE-family HTH domain